MNAIYNFFKSAPIIFPLLALFLMVLTIYEISLFWFGGSVPALYLWRPVIMLAYTATWVGASYLKKWGAIGFVIVSLIVMLIGYLGDDSLKNSLGDLLFRPIPINLLMSMLIFLFFKRFK